MYLEKKNNVWICCAVDVYVLMWYETVQHAKIELINDKNHIHIAQFIVTFTDWFGYVGRVGRCENVGILRCDGRSTIDCLCELLVFFAIISLEYVCVFMLHEIFKNNFVMNSNSSVVHRQFIISVFLIQIVEEKNQTRPLISHRTVHTRPQPLSLYILFSIMLFIVHNEFHYYLKVLSHYVTFMATRLHTLNTPSLTCKINVCCQLKLKNMYIRYDIHWWQKLASFFFRSLWT